VVWVCLGKVGVVLFGKGWVWCGFVWESWVWCGFACERLGVVWVSLGKVVCGVGFFRKGWVWVCLGMAELWCGFSANGLSGCGLRVCLQMPGCGSKGICLQV